MTSITTPFPKKSYLCGIDIDNLTTDELLEKIEEFIKDGVPRQVAYVNIDSLNQVFEDRKYKDIIHDADLVYPDGMGVVWASRLFGTSLPERVNLGDFLPQLCKICIDKKFKLYLLGGEPGVAQKAAHFMEVDFPGLKIVGTQDGFFSEDENKEVIEKVREAKPDILMVGMGVPKQEKWIKRNLEDLGVPVTWGVGALFDYYSGKFPRAPVWMRKIGMEWGFRLLLEPKRLWKRYLLGNFLFTLRVTFLIIIDIISAGTAWMLAYQVRDHFETVFQKPINTVESYLISLPLIILTWIVICARFGLYRRRREFKHFEQTKSIFLAGIWFTVSAAAISFLLKEQDLGRSVVLISGFFIVVILGISRFLFRIYETRMLRQGYGKVRTCILGTQGLAEKVSIRVEDDPRDDREIVGFISPTSDNSLETFARHPVLGHVGQLKELIESEHIEEVIVADVRLSHEEILNLIAGTESNRVKFNVISDMFEILTSNVDIEEIDDFPVVALNSGAMNDFQLIVKKVIDLMIAFIVSIPTLMLLPFIVIGIKASSPGPALFKHQRVGKDGKLFTIYKFRTMHQNVQPYEEAPHIPEDERVIPFGKFLRRTSLDELPQILNVFKGEMSIVGPRPEMPFIVEHYEVWQKRRLIVKPGITGLWQIIGRKDLPLHSNLEYDFYYIQNQSLILDLIIMLKTLPVVLFGKGAY